MIEFCWTLLLQDANIWAAVETFTQSGPVYEHSRNFNSMKGMKRLHFCGLILKLFILYLLYIILKKYASIDLFHFFGRQINQIKHTADTSSAKIFRQWKNIRIRKWKQKCFGELMLILLPDLFTQSWSYFKLLAKYFLIHSSSA